MTELEDEELLLILREKIAESHQLRDEIAKLRKEALARGLDDTPDTDDIFGKSPIPEDKILVALQQSRGGLSKADLRKKFGANPVPALRILIEQGSAEEDDGVFKAT